MNDETAYDDELTDDDINDFVDDEDIEDVEDVEDELEDGEGDWDDDEDGAPLAVDEFLELPYEEQRAYGEEHFDHGCDEPDEFMTVDPDCDLYPESNWDAPEAVTW